MKKFLAFLLLLFVQLTGSVQAATQAGYGDYYILNYRFNYSKTRIDGQSAKRYVHAKVFTDADTADEAFDQFKRRVEKAFLTAANRNGLENHGYSLDNSEKSRYEIVIFILDVDEDGEHKVEANIVDKKNDDDVVETVKAKAGSGKFNSFMNLFLEQLEKSGERFGDKLADTMDDLRD